MKEFIGIVHQDEGSALGIHFPDVPGCVSSADALDDLSANAQEALALHFEDTKMVTPRTLSEIEKDPAVAAELAEGGVSCARIILG